MYNQKVMEIFAHPKNIGGLRNANAVGTVGNPTCGDIMKIYLRIEDGKVIDAKFKTFGCAAAIVSSSLATEMVKGMTIEEVLNFDNSKILQELGELPVQKIHCSILAKEALASAIQDYYRRQEKQAKKEIK